MIIVTYFSPGDDDLSQSDVSPIFPKLAIRTPGSNHSPSFDLMIESMAHEPRLPRGNRDLSSLMNDYAVESRGKKKAKVHFPYSTAACRLSSFPFNGLLKECY